MILFMVYFLSMNNSKADIHLLFKKFSDVSISKAKEKFQSLESKVELLVDNCESTTFNNNKLKYLSAKIWSSHFLKNK